MINAIWCVFFAGLLPYICAGIAKSGFKNFDNNNPRQWLAAQTGFRARANAAQHNSFEAFPFFAAAVLLALFREVPANTVDLAALIFIVARIGFITCYLLDKPVLRTLCWVLAITCVCTLFVLAALTTF